MTRVVVDVMPKPEILDPQGQAVLGALRRLGFAGIATVRQGKRFEIELEAEPTTRDHCRDRARCGNPARQPGDRGLRRCSESRPMRIGVVTFPGSLDDGDAARAVRLAGGEPVVLWHADADLCGVDARGAAGRVLLRRLPALRRDRPVRAGDGDRWSTQPEAACRCSASATGSRCCASRTCCRVR